MFHAENGFLYMDMFKSQSAVFGHMWALTLVHTL